MKLLEDIIRNTERFVASIPKEDRKRYGQFFTAEKTAVYMSCMFDFDIDKPELKILDAGAGTGLLSAAVIERLVKLGYKGHLHLVCYETDTNVLPVLIKNLEQMKKEADFSFLVISDNYINIEKELFYNNYSKSSISYLIVFLSF